MAKRAFAVGPRERDRALNVVGEQVTVLASAADTGGYELFFQDGPEGTGPPPHAHDWDESFFVLGGTIEFGMGDDTMTASPGTLVHLPAGTRHWFRFGPGGGQMFSVTGAGSAAADFFRAVDAEVPVGEASPESLGPVADRHALRILTG